MESIKKILKSRTILTLLFLVAFNCFNAVSNLLDPTISAVINTILLTVAGYFRINTNTKF